MSFPDTSVSSRSCARPCAPARTPRSGLRAYLRVPYVDATADAALESGHGGYPTRSLEVAGELLHRSALTRCLLDEFPSCYHAATGEPTGDSARSDARNPDFDLQGCRNHETAGPQEKSLPTMVRLFSTMAGHSRRVSNS